MKWKFNHWLYATAALAGAAVHAQTCPSWPTLDRFTINVEEVTDKRTGLIWKRCSVGQTLSGNSCTGSASVHTHEAALTLPNTQNTGNSPTGWRLPNVKELASLADKGCQNPAIDSTAFPGTPAFYYWTSSPYVGISSSNWYVNFITGLVGYGGGRLSPLNVRLVRSSQ